VTRIIRHHYASITAWRAAIAKPRLRGADNDGECKAPSQTWDYGVGWDGAQHFAAVGWAEGANAIRAMVDKLRGALEPPELFAPGYDVAPFGHEVALDMGRFVDGDPEHWRVSQLRRSGKMTVAVAINASGNIAGEMMQRRSACGLAIAWVLHDAGYEVDLRGTHTSEYDETNGEVVHINRSFSLPMDPHVAAYWLAHPASARRHSFRWLEAHNVRCTRDGYGRPVDLAPEGAVYLRAISSGNADSVTPWESDESMLAEARAKLAALGSLDPTH
jgi:hypothetical protein